MCLHPWLSACQSVDADRVRTAWRVRAATRKAGGAWLAAIWSLVTASSAALGQDEAPEVAASGGIPATTWLALNVEEDGGPGFLAAPGATDRSYQEDPSVGLNGEAGADRDDDADDEGEDESNEDDDDDGMERYMEELFLGRVVYPQDKGEVQITEGYFKGVESVSDAVLFTEVEYGITDRFQLSLEVPVEFNPGESFDGVRALGVEAYWNFYSDRATGRALGAGFEVGAPLDAPEDEPRQVIYEPFFIAYQDFGGVAANFSAAVEIEDPVSGDERAETTGELAAAVFGAVGPFVPMLECQVEIGPEETPARLAPGLYVRRFWNAVDVGASLPVGLNRDAPEIGVFMFAIVEFETASD